MKVFINFFTFDARKPVQNKIRYLQNSITRAI